jgi:PAS domain S-box-containing protein
MSEARRLVDLAVRSSVNGVVITDATLPDNPIVYVNPAFELMTGFSAEEAVGRNCRFLQGLDTDQPALDELRVAIRESCECRVVLRNYKRDGALFWNELSVSPVYDEEGRLTNFVGVQNDITERKRVEEALRKSEDRLRLAVESTGLGTWDFNPLTGELRWDEQCKALFGLPPEAEVDYEVFLAGLHPEDRERTDRTVQGALAPTGEGDYDTEYRTMGLEDGVERWVAARGQTLFDEAGRAVRFVGTVLDVTERKRAEEKLRFQRALLEAQSETSMEGILVVSAEGKIISFNRRYVEMWGIPEEVMALRSSEAVLQAIHAKVLDPRGFLDRVAYLYEHPGEESRDEILLKDGRTFDRYSSPIGGRDDAYYGRVWYFRDITERKRTEEAQRFLAEVGAMLSSSLDYQATLTRVARLVVPHLADWCAVDIVDEDDGSVHRLAVSHEDPDKVALAYELGRRYPPDPEARYGVSQVLRTGRPELAPEIPESLLDEAAIDAEHREMLRGLSLESYIIVPLVARGRTLGAITLASAESGRRYGTAELELAEELARRAALAVDNARLYSARSRIARTLQGSLLPSRLPEVPGVEVGLRYLPAGEVDVGGDFYDLFDAKIEPRNDDIGSSESSGPAYGVVIGDVCGKGAEAAAVLALARYTIRAVAMHEERPAAVLAGLNEAMLRQRRERDDHKFCTVTYARLEPEGGAEGGAKVTVCRGGHSAPLLLKTDGNICGIGDPGRVIGVFDAPRLTHQEAYLAPGDALVLYTDGVSEARSPDGTFFGEERIECILRSSAGLDAPALASRIENAVLMFQENGSRDDVAVLVLRVPE